MHEDAVRGTVDPPPPILSRAAYPLIIVAAICAVYSQAVRFDFVTYDDYDLIKQNTEYLGNLRNLSAAFTTHVFSTHRAESAYYRPLLLVSFIADYRLWGLNPFGFHLVNILLHAAAAVVLYFLALRVTREPAVSLVTGLLFAVHPIQTEAVAWISGGNDVLLGLWILLTVFCFIRSGEGSLHRKGYSILTGIFFTLALFTKEAAVFYILLLPLYGLCVGKVSWRTMFKAGYLSRLLLPAMALILYLFVRLQVLGQFIGAERLYGTTPLLQRILEVPSTLAEHFRLILLPMGLSVVHPRDSLFWFQPPWNFAAVLVPLLPAAAIWLSWRREPVICFGLLWFAVGLFPVLNIFPLAVPVLEHRLYVPLAGLALAGCRGAWRLCGMIPARSRLGPAHVPPGGTQRDGATGIFLSVSAAVILILAIVSFERVPVWKDSETLWTDAIAKAPQDARSYFNLAGYYFDRGEYERTAGLLNRYLDRRPDDMTAYSKLRQTYFLEGQYLDAARICRKMIALNPTNPNRYTEAAELFVHLNVPDSAIAILQDGLNAVPNSFLLHQELGALFARSGNSTDAEREYLLALSSNPKSASAHFGLGLLYGLRGEDLQSIGHIEEGMRYAKPPPEILELLRILYARTGQHEKEQELLREQGS
jgi:hypothetical protein